MRWINSPEGKKELGAHFMRIEEENSLDPQKSAEIFARISSRVKFGEEMGAKDLEPEAARHGARKSHLGHRVKIAAAVMAVMAMSWLLVHTYSRKEESLPSVALQPEWVERSVPVGQKLRLKLDDGSEVTLNSLSSIKFPKRFTSHSREVVLEGEAFFHVTPDQGRPFLVRSGQLETMVLGTSFLVRSGGDSQAAMVAVLTGKVQVSLPDSARSHRETVQLKAMDGVTVSEGDSSFRKMQVGYDEIFAWKDDVISFHDSAFPEVTKRLENWYGVTILSSKDWIPRKNYSGRFQGQSLEEVLLGLSFVYDFQFRISNDTVTIYHQPKNQLPMENQTENN